MSKVVVTGGAGFIGSHLTDQLVAQGHEVHVVDTLIAGKREDVHTNATLHEVDVRDLSVLTAIMSGAKYVFHLAALPRVQFSIDHPLESHDTNVNGTLNALLAARDAGAQRFVFASSSSVYGDLPVLPMHEEMLVVPQSPYGVQKRIGELYVKNVQSIYGLPTVSLRFFNVYGPRQDPSSAYALVTIKFLFQKKEGKPLTITGDGTQTRDFTYVSDTVSGIIAAAESPRVGAGEIINLGAGSSVSVNRIAELIGGPTTYIAPRVEPHDTLADRSRAEELLGWKPLISIEEGIAKLKSSYGIA
jgi:UDP-glucose 4-epimerase